MKIFKWPRTPEQWRSILVSAVIFTLLLIIVQPELRVLMIVIDIIGVDLYLLFFLTQLRSYGPLVSMIGLAIAGHLVALISRLASAANWIGHVMVPRECVWIAGSAMMTACIAMALVVFKTKNGSANTWT
jgi:hypothetical protein